MITLWGRKNSINVQKVLWTLAELNLSYEHKNVGGDNGGLDSAEFLQLNPHGRIPVLQDSKLTVWESNSIVRYLCAQYGKNILWFADPATQSLSERWVDWSLASLQPFYLGLFWGFYRTPPEKRNDHAIQGARENCIAHVDLINKHLAQHNYMAGNNFTMADILIGVLMFRYFEMGVNLPKPVNVMRWYDQLTQRPAYRETVMVPFDELRAKSTS
jgi:glutathione S-transferase